MPNLIYPLVPVAAVLIGAVFAAWRQPGPRLLSAVQHLAAGVVFAAAAAEILPQVKHGGSLWATLIGGTLGVVVMLSIKSLESRWKGPAGMVGAIGLTKPRQSIQGRISIISEGNGPRVFHRVTTSPCARGYG